MPSGHLYLDDEGATRECGDEGRMCEACFEERAAWWAAYFGLRDGMSPEEKRRQLEAWR